MGPESNCACILLGEPKASQEQARNVDDCSDGLAEHHQRRNPASVSWMGSKLQAVTELRTKI